MNSNIVKKCYFYYLFQERSYLSQSPARVKNNVLCRTQMQDMRTPGEVGQVLRLPFSRRHLSSVIISDTNDKHLYFIWAHSCMLAPSQNSHSPRCLTFTIKNCVCPIFLRPLVSIYSGSAWVCNLCYCRKTGRMQWPMHDSALSDHFNPLANYQAKYPTCYLTSRSAVRHSQLHVGETLHFSFLLLSGWIIVIPLYQAAPISLSTLQLIQTSAVNVLKRTNIRDHIFPMLVPTDEVINVNSELNSVSKNSPVFSLRIQL